MGVDPKFTREGFIKPCAWIWFREVTELPKKSDSLLEDYYIRIMVDVRSLLSENEREKRTKGPRTKHKPG